MRFFMSGFLHESKSPSPLSKSSKYFRKYFSFHGDIDINFQVFPKKFNLRITIPCNQRLVGTVTCRLNFTFLLVWRLPGIVSQRSVDRRVSLPGDRPTSEKQYPEIGWSLGIVTWKSLRKKSYFVNFSTKAKNILKIFWEYIQGARTFWFVQKNRHKKSHASVPPPSTR